jgi:type VI secretion system protein ImpL
MFAKLRRVLPILGLLLIALVIWFGGPYVAFGEYIPLESARARLIAIALVILTWVGLVVWKRVQANRKSDQLVAAVVKQADAEPRPSADVVQLRERFEEAVGTLKQKRKSGHSLYELPWYVIIGAPGSGKTTALVNSGLHFPLEQRSGKGALRGVGGTRNCDWWFTDEAVFLDTAGRYTTQDSDANADSAGWLEFLALLRKYRKRRPVNGIILTISAQDLIMQGHGAPEGHVEAARRRLIELNKELNIQLPVYLMVTKCDLVAGFTEYFDDLSQEGRAQVWGVTFPYEQTQKGEAAKAFPAEFDALVTRLNERVFARVEEDRDVRRRTKAFGFPQQMASLREGLSQFVAEVFGSTRFDQQILLRGVYFTSGTQEGNPIDRLLGAIGRRFAVSAEAVAPPPGRGKAYFIEKLLKDVLFPESGLAGVNRRFEFQMAAAQVGLYAAMVALAVLGVIVWSISYNRNRNYIESVGEDVARFQQVPLTPADVAVDAALPRLDAVQAVATSANRFEEDTPLMMRWGLYQGSSVGNAADDAYLRELNGALLPRVEARLRQRLATTPEPETLYEYLKAYLMLGEPGRLDKEHLAAVVDADWKLSYAAAPDTAAALSKHFRALLDRGDQIRPIVLDQVRIAQARSTILQASIPRIIYTLIKFDYAADGRALRLDEAAGAGSDQVLRRKSGRPLSEPVPAIYTKPVFEEITGKNAGELVKQFNDDYWVWGEKRPPLTAGAQLSAEVIDVYEKDYIATWDAVLQDFDVSFDSQQTANALAILAGPTSPLRGLLRTVDANTYLVRPPDPAAAPPGVIDSAKDRVGRLLNRGLGAAGVPTEMPGAEVTAHFAAIHQLVAGEPGAAPIDRVLGKLGQLQAQISPVGQAVVGGTDPLAAITQSGSGELVKSIRQDASTLPPSVGGLVTNIADRAAGAVLKDARGELETRYMQDVVLPCREIVNNKYPFVRTSGVDARPEDFGRLFGAGGIFDQFFKSRVEPLVNMTRQPWTWRTDASGVPVGGSLTMLRQFESAQRIRDMYFSGNANIPQVRFMVTPITMDQETSRFTLDVDGQPAEYRFGPERTYQMTWPGQKPGAAATFEERGGRAPNIATQGAWAWQRLLDAAELKEESDSRYVLTWRRDAHFATVRIEATSLRNPFNKPDVQNFRCG